MPRMQCAYRAACLAAILLFTPAVSATPDESLATEEEPVVEAATLVRPALLSGPGFSVDSRVELRGYMGHFTLDTRLGPLQAESVEILAERIAELPALEALDRVTHSEAFLHAAGDRLAATGRALAQVVLHPVDSLLGIPAGVARYFGARIGKTARQAQSLSDRTARELGTRGDAWPEMAGPMADARDDDAPAQDDASPWYAPLQKEATREIKRRIKYGQVKRALAERLGIDPYTTNPLIQERLSGLAWVGSGGSFSAGTALGSIGGLGAEVLSTSGQINELVWKLAPEDLRDRNGERLQAWCRDSFLIRQFLRRGAFSPTLQTALADALDTLQPAGGCDALLELGMTAASRLEARFLVNALRMLAAQPGERAKGGELRPIGAGLAYAAIDGEMLLPLPVDRLSWTAEVRDFLDRPEFRVVHKTVLIAGDASLAARRGLAERGWNIRLHAPWPGAPPYAGGNEPAAVDVDR